MKFILAILCVIPSAWVNANAQIAIGAGNDMIAAVIGFAVLAAVFTMRCLDSRGAARIGWGAMAALFMIMNAFISLSGISAVRDASMDIRAERQRLEGDRRAIADQITGLRNLIGKPTSSAIVQAEMATLSGWKWEKAKIRLEQVKQVEALEAKLTGWSAGTEPVPSAVDPGVANIASIAVTLFNVRLSERFLAALLSGAFAILLELGADLGPIAIYSLLSGGSGGSGGFKWSQPAKTLKQAVAGIPGNPPTVPKESDLTEFITGLYETVQGEFEPATGLYRSYVGWAKKHDRPAMSQTLFGTTLKCMGIRKLKRDGSWRYCDLRLKKGLRIV